MYFNLQGSITKKKIIISSPNQKNYLSLKAKFMNFKILNNYYFYGVWTLLQVKSTPNLHISTESFLDETMF